jgi:hypothetical protein
MASKKNVNNTYILYFVIFFLLLLLILTSAILFFTHINKKEKIVIVEKTLKVSDSNCPKVDNNSIPIYPKELPSYNNSEYQQIGILTSDDGNDPIILPLFSKKTNNHRDRWNYYTATDKNNMLRLPINHDNMKCDEDIGCNEIYDGDKLFIEMYKGKIFIATIYKKNTPLYFADKY